MVKPKKQTYQLVKIHWLDTAVRTEWRDIETAKQSQPLQIITVGYLLSQDDEKVVVAPTIAEHEDVGSVHTIPKSWVKKLTIIKGHEIIYE